MHSNCNTFHISEHYGIILHSLPELVTTVVGSAGGVGEGERVGGAATNSTIFKDSTSSITVTIMFNCDTLHTNKHYRRIFLHSLPELTTAVVGK